MFTCLMSGLGLEALPFNLVLPIVGLLVALGLDAEVGWNTSLADKLISLSSLEARLFKASNELDKSKISVESKIDDAKLGMPQEQQIQL